MEVPVESRDQSAAGLADPGTVGAIVVGLAGRAVVPGLRMLGGTLQVAQGMIDAIGGQPQAREVTGADPLSARLVALRS